jgi:hypothetical protein
MFFFVLIWGAFGKRDTHWFFCLCWGLEWLVNIPSCVDVHPFCGASYKGHEITRGWNLIIK